MIKTTPNLQFLDKTLLLSVLDMRNITFIEDYVIFINMQKLDIDFFLGEKTTLITEAIISETKILKDDYITQVIELNVPKLFNNSNDEDDNMQIQKKRYKVIKFIEKYSTNEHYELLKEGIKSNNEKLVEFYSNFIDIAEMSKLPEKNKKDEGNEQTKNNRYCGLCTHPRRIGECVDDYKKIA